MSESTVLGQCCCHSLLPPRVRRTSSSRAGLVRSSLDWRPIILLKHSATGLAAAAALLVASQCHADVDASLSFTKNCVGCHVGGGNVVQPGATLSLRDLKRNGIESVEEIYDLVYSGKGKMPGYGVACTPRGKCTFGPRLPDKEIKELSQYVLDKAAVDWK